MQVVQCTWHISVCALLRHFSRHVAALSDWPSTRSSALSTHHPPPPLFVLFNFNSTPHAALCAGLHRLRGELRAVGSDLVVRTGPAWDSLAALAQQTGVERIVMEREEESRWVGVCGGVLGKGGCCENAG